MNKTTQKDDFSGKNLLAMSVISAVVYLLLAIAIIYWFHKEGVAGVFDHGYSFARQIFIGAVAGCLTAGVIIFIAAREPVSQVLDDFYLYRMISQTRFTNFDRIQLSLFAGVGEELLFRGAIQPVLGIWVTSVIFIGIHGYFKFSSAVHLFFGLMMFGLSVVLGYLFEYAGLVAAMSAHAMYDFVMLWWVDTVASRKKYSNSR